MTALVVIVDSHHNLVADYIHIHIISYLHYILQDGSYKSVANGQDRLHSNERLLLYLNVHRLMQEMLFKVGRGLVELAY